MNKRFLFLRWSLVYLFIHSVAVNEVSAQQPDTLNRLLLARAYNDAGRPDKVLQLFQNESIDAVKSPDIIFELARAEYESGNYQSSIDLLISSNSSETSKVTLQLAKCYAQLNEADKAVYYLEKHLKIKQKVMQNVIRNDKAFITIEKSPEWIELWKTDWYSKQENSLAEADYEFRSGKTHEALQILNAITRKRKSMDEAFALEARIYLLLKEYKNGLEAINGAIMADSKNADYYYLKSRIELSDGKAKKALHSITEALALDSSTIGYYFTLAEIQNSLENYEEAEKNIQLVTQLVPDEGNLFKAGEIYKQAGDLLTALKYFNRCIGLNNRNPRYYLTRGETYMATGMFGFAEKDFTMVLDFDPYNGEIYDKRAYARYKQNKTEDACNDWHKARQFGYVSAENGLKNYCRNYSN